MSKYSTAKANLPEARQIAFLIFLLVTPKLYSSQNFLTDFNNVPSGNHISDSMRVGYINNIKLSIPVNYLISDVTYEGEDTSKINNNSKEAQKNARIADFGILLRISNFQPRNTIQDWQDWRTASTMSRPSFMSSWMMVDFDNRHPVEPSQVNNMPQRLHEDEAHWGPYIRDHELYHGLQHYESIQSVDSPSGHVEYFYREATSTTIVCRSQRIKVPPFDTHDECEHHFLIPGIRVMAEAFYTKADLPKWSEIEDNVKKIIYSFYIK